MFGRDFSDMVTSLGQRRHRSLKRPRENDDLDGEDMSIRSGSGSELRDVPMIVAISAPSDQDGVEEVLNIDPMSISTPDEFVAPPASPPADRSPSPVAIHVLVMAGLTALTPLDSTACRGNDQRPCALCSN